MTTAIGSTPTSTPLPNNREPSKTTWKTHALVVSGYLLITLGFALVAASFYMSLIVHPLLAFATPVAPLAAGCICINRANGTTLHLPIFKGSPPPFNGIANPKGIDCSINVILQLLFHIPAFASRIKAANSWFHLPFRRPHPLEKFFKAFEDYHKGKEVDSSLIRQELEKAKVTTSSDNSVEDDPIYFFEYFAKKIGYHLPTLHERYVWMNKGAVDHTGQATKTGSEIPVYFFNVGNYFYNMKNPTLEKGIKKYFHNVVESHGYTTVALQFFESPPEDLLISVAQTHEGGAGKTTRQIKCPEVLTLSATEIGEETSYACDAFIYHRGTDRLKGHWMNVIKKEGKWWHFSDKDVFEIPPSKAFELMETASIIHYSKL